MNLNKVFIVGRVTADIVLRSTPSGAQVANFSVATNRVWTDKTGGKREETEFHNVVLWGRQAEIAGQYLKKGSEVMVEGRLQTRSWDDKSGQKRRTTEIIGERIQLGQRPFNQGGGQFGGDNATAVPNQAEKSPEETIPTIDIDEEEIKEEDLPF